LRELGWVLVILQVLLSELVQKYSGKHTSTACSKNTGMTNLGQLVTISYKATHSTNCHDPYWIPTDKDVLKEEALG